MRQAGLTDVTVPLGLMSLPGIKTILGKGGLGMAEMAGAGAALVAGPMRMRSSGAMMHTMQRNKCPLDGRACLVSCLAMA